MRHSFFIRGYLRDFWRGTCWYSISLTHTDISSPENIDDFVKESILMLGFDHPNVLKLLGVCFDTDDHLPLIVLPYMANGDLRSYLMSKRGTLICKNLTEFPEVISNFKYVGIVPCAQVSQCK